MTQARPPHTSTSEANTTEYPDGKDPARWRILLILLVAVFMSLISVSIVNVALPSIQAGLDEIGRAHV